jgi:hypothetical protein
MVYQEFKKSFFPSLTERMAKLGFVKGKSKTPIYWHYPCEDQRLVWVVRFVFSPKGNEFFSLLIGPYWMGYTLPSDDPFPHCVGAGASHIGHKGVDSGQITWKAEVAQFERAVEVLQANAPRFFARYATPQLLLQHQPRAELAFDLGDHALAYDLLRTELVRLYAADLTLNAASKAGRQLHIEQLERTEAYLTESARHIGREHELEECRAQAREQAARPKRRSWLRRLIGQLR